jgi:hypothetical protein
MKTSAKGNAITYITYTGLIIATTILIWVYSFIGFWLYGVLIALVGLIWAAGIRRNQRGVNLGGLLVFVGSAAYGVRVQAAAIWLLAATVFALIAWDLGEFRHRLAQVEVSGADRQLQAVHLQRLVIVSVVGLLAGAIALGLQVNLTFGWAVLIAVLMVAGLSWLFRLVRGG